MFPTSLVYIENCAITSSEFYLICIMDKVYFVRTRIINSNPILPLETIFIVCKPTSHVCSTKCTEGLLSPIGDVAARSGAAVVNQALAPISVTAITTGVYHC